MTQIKLRVLAAQLAVKVLAQLNGKLIGRAEQQHAPDITQQVNHHGRQHQRTDPHHHPCGGVMLFRNTIHDVSHHFGRDQLQNGNDNKQGHRAEVALPLPTKVPA